MKIIASILIMYFAVLMAQPFVNMGTSLPAKADSCHSGMSCSEMMKHNHKAPAKQQSNTCNRDFCNPFVPCGTSIVQPMPLHNFANPVFEVANKLKPATDENITSNYLSDCWRPPELS